MRRTKGLGGGGCEYSHCAPPSGIFRANSGRSRQSNDSLYDRKVVSARAKSSLPAARIALGAPLRRPHEHSGNTASLHNEHQQIEQRNKHVSLAVLVLQTSEYFQKITLPRQLVHGNTSCIPGAHTCFVSARRVSVSVLDASDASSASREACNSSFRAFASASTAAFAAAAAASFSAAAACAASAGSPVVLLPFALMRSVAAAAADSACSLRNSASVC